MQNANVHISSVTFSCPYCDEPIQSPKTGSFMVSLPEELPERLMCSDCRREVGIPSLIKKGKSLIKGVWV